MLVCSTFNNEGLRVDTERWECLLLTAAETWNPLPVTILFSFIVSLFPNQSDRNPAGIIRKVNQGLSVKD